MDLRTVVTLSTLLLVTAESNRTAPETTGKGEISLSAQTNGTNSNCSCASAAPKFTSDPTSSPSSPAPALGLLTIGWTSECEGDVNLILYHPSNSSSPVCHDSELNVQSLLRNVCENKKGCKDQLRRDKSKNSLAGIYITESGATETRNCVKLRVRCTVEVLPDVQGQLRGYKVVTALLCCVLLVLLLMRFTRPTVKALQKRLSDRRQNRWIGPTQSHSVSYHRGKTAVKSNDDEKRMSYPALERLAVIDSREPSSNRNSGYNF